jgi:hypothetical protein
VPVTKRVDESTTGLFIAVIFQIGSILSVISNAASDPLGWRFHVSVFALVTWSMINGWLLIEKFNDTMRRRRRQRMEARHG